MWPSPDLNRRRRGFEFHRGSSFLLLVVALAFTSHVALAGAVTTGEAFGKPGADPKWAPSRNTILGTARTDTTSYVWFTGFNGIIGEVFYPSADTPATVDWQFLVGDSAKTWVDEEKVSTDSRVELIDPHALSWKVTNKPKNTHPYSIQKTVFTDPGRNALVVRVTFTATSGTLGDFNLYTLYHPALDNDGQATRGFTANYMGRPMLVAQNLPKDRRDEHGNTYRPAERGSASALASSLDFKSGMLSSGFVAASDGYQDLLGSRSPGVLPDLTMDWTYDQATDGNIAQMAMFDLVPVASRTSVTFTLVLGFGDNEASAEAAAAGTLGEDPSGLLTRYNAQWNAYANTLDNQRRRADQQYYVAAMALKAAQDKNSGGMVAGLGNPWGDTGGSWKQKDNQNVAVYVQDSDGYHVVFPRDLYKSASAMIVAGDRATADKALDFLFNGTMQRPDGHFPRYAFTDNATIQDAVQMDQTAFPIILAWKLGRTDAITYAHIIKLAADFLVKNGPRPRFGNERWEENPGYSPSTIAAEIAGLVCAADIARINGDADSQWRYLASADYWQGMVENWTFTTRGEIKADGGDDTVHKTFFERLDDDGNPNDGHTIGIGNGGGRQDERSVIDAGFLELVRHGVKSWDNPYILASLPAVDANIKRTIAGKGDGFFRYNDDGYGENPLGLNWPSSGSRGRLWPILSGERGHHVIAQGGDPASYLDAMRDFSDGAYLIPEQVFDNAPPMGFVAGSPTKSITPLNWSLGEYICLLASSAQKKVLDQPSIVYKRYVTDAYKPHAGTPVDYDPGNATQGKALTIFYKGTLATSTQVTLHWGFNNWQVPTDKPMIRRGDGFWEATVSVPINATSLNLAFTDGASWDNNAGVNWNPTIAPVSFAPFNTPVDTWPNPAPGGQPINVYYKGPLATSATAITLHWGRDDPFLDPADVPMTKRPDGYWFATITAPAANSAAPDKVPILQFAFQDQAGNWDNNGGTGNNYVVMRVPR